MMNSLRVVGIGGALREGSTSDAALTWMLASLRQQGCETTAFKGADLNFAAYDPSCSHADEPGLKTYLDAVRGCDAVVIASPVYHGGPSGLIKNAIDHLQPLMGDRRSYLTGRPVSCLAAGGGLQGAVSTLSALRCVVHALRGWPTPMQVPINSSSKHFDEDGACTDAKLEQMLVAARDDLLCFARAMANR
jgi:FMN reductase